MRSYIYVLFLALLTSSFVRAQYIVTVDATVMDTNTNKPIPYVNVGFIDQAIGTVSDQNGKVLLEFDENTVGQDAILQISMLGYESIKINLQDLYARLAKTDKIYLRPSVTQLDEATIVAEKRRKLMLNRPRGVYNFIGYWKDKKGLGGEIATLVKVRHSDVKLRALNFIVNENESDSLRVRVNVYEESGNKPGNKLITENIYHTIKGSNTEVAIDLTPYNILVQDDFVIGIELVKVYGDYIGFSVQGTNKGKAYIRDVSQDAWKKFTNTGMAFTVEASVPAEGLAYKDRKQPKDITLFWDTSLSAAKRDLNKELEFLTQYLKSLDKVNVTLVPFAQAPNKAKQFTIKNGNTKELLQEIKSYTYNGATNFEHLLFRRTLSDAYLFFTDGHATFGEHDSVYSIPIFYVNSSKNADRSAMQNSSELSGGYFVDLYLSEINTALGQMQKDMDDFRNFDATQDQMVTGTVSFSGDPIQGAMVTVQGTLQQTQTNVDGTYEIPALTGDILKFEFLSMKTQLREVKSNPEIINISFASEAKILESVSIKATKKDTLDGPELEILGKREDKKALGYARTTIFNDDFPKSAVYLSDIIRGRFPSVLVFGFGDQARYLIRGVHSLENQADPVFIVDDAILSTPPIFLQPARIESISLIAGLAGAVRYGSLARGGIFIIKTKKGVKYKTPGEDIMLVKGNDYQEKLPTLDPYFNAPDYVSQLKKADSLEEALQIYYSLRPKHLNEIPFYQYAASYFYRYNTEIGNEILSNIAEIAWNNPQALRSLAYHLEANEQGKKAMIIYERIFELQYDTSAQAYLDLARIYSENQKLSEAFAIYKRILANEEKKLNFSPILEQAEAQFQKFANLYRNYIPEGDLPKMFSAVKSLPVKVVLDWSDPMAEFEVQFVNPEKKYFVWSRSYINDPQMIDTEIKNGVYSKQFVVDKNFPGEWIVNIKSLNEEYSKENPVYLKYTIYTNYGLPEETKKVKFIRLYNQNQKATLDRFENLADL